MLTDLLGFARTCPIRERLVRAKSLAEALPDHDGASKSKGPDRKNARLAKQIRLE